MCVAFKQENTDIPMARTSQAKHFFTWQPSMPPSSRPKHKLRWSMLSQLVLLSWSDHGDWKGVFAQLSVVNTLFRTYSRNTNVVMYGSLCVIVYITSVFNF